MPFNGSGGFIPIAAPNYPAVSGQPIYAAQFNANMTDLFSGLGTCVTRDGQSPFTANIPAGGFKVTGLGVATVSGDALAHSQSGANLNNPTLVGATFTAGPTWAADPSSNDQLSRKSYVDTLTTTIVSNLANTASVGLGDALVGVKITATGATARTQHSRNEETLSVKDFGATGDGATDDSAAIVLAEIGAFASGKVLLFPSGGTYLYDGVFTNRVNIEGYGATLKQKNTTAATTALLYVNTAHNVTIRGLTIDGNSKSKCFQALSSNHCRLTDAKAINGMQAGFAFYSCNDIGVSGCYADGVIYFTAGVGSADGFYFGGCTNVRVVNSYATNFRRIGFVSEADGGTKSDYYHIMNCVASNAANCDDSATEYNAGFWSENTNNYQYTNCTAWNISSGTAQTNGRVSGFVSGFGESSACQQNYVNCHVIGNTARIPSGFRCEGTTKFPSISYTNCFVKKCISGLTTIGGVNLLRINGFAVDDIVTAGANGGILFDITTLGINQIIIDGVVFSNQTHNADSADINFFTGNATTVYNLYKANGITHIMRTAALKAVITDCAISCGSTTYGSFLGTNVIFNNCDLTPRNGSAADFFVNSGSMAVASNITFNGGYVSHSANWNPTLTGASVNMYFNSTKFNNFTMTVTMTGSFNHIFSDCVIGIVDATKGFYYSNSAAATKQVLQVTGCMFTDPTVANTPLRKNVNNPTAAVLQSNTRVATNLWDFSAGVTQANNTVI